MSEGLEAIRSVDASGELDGVLGLPEHLGDALWRVESARIEPHEAAGVIACGMGGSGVGADLARAALGDRLRRPLFVVRDYELEPWTTPDYTVLCTSYSGDTEETLACFAAAEAVGARRIAATTGGALAAAARSAGVPVIGMPAGLQPRTAVGYTFAIAAEVVALAGAAPAVRTEIDSAASHLARSRDALIERSVALADQLEGTVPSIYGCDLTTPAAYRWKTELNENAKLPAFANSLPELDHNELAGWEGAAACGARMSAVFLEDRDQHPRERRRAELTARAIEPHAAAVVRLETEGETRTERLLWAVMLGDLVSLQLAARRGVDPAPIEAIERLKREL